MAAVTHGMNPDEVERLGRKLQEDAANLQATLKAIQKLVHSTTWVGPDADTFKNQWWPDHQTRLSNAANDLHGFGQSALNNASEQRNVSGR